MVHNVRVRVGEGGDDAAMGVLAGLRRVLRGVRPEQFNHQLTGRVAETNLNSRVAGRRLTTKKKDGRKNGLKRPRVRKTIKMKSNSKLPGIRTKKIGML